MSTETPLKISELSYAEYQARQYREIQHAALLTRADAIRYGRKFDFQDGAWVCLPYEGYAIVSLVNNNPGNELIGEELQEMQQQLIVELDLGHKLYALPKESFHQTIANTLSAERFHTHIQSKGLEAEYPKLLTQAFQKIDGSNVSNPIAMKLIGLGIFGSALGILGVFDHESAYNRILNFREKIYTNPTLNQYDIKRTRPFVGHLTLLYFGKDLTPKEGQRLAECCNSYNQEIAAKNLCFHITHTQLCKYQNLSQFEHLDHFPSFSFVET